MVTTSPGLIRLLPPAVVVAAALVVLPVPSRAQAPAPMQPAIAESATITVLKGLTVPQFETEMRHFVQAVGMNCGGCHTRGNFASEDNPKKAIARRMIEMTQALNRKYFAAYTPAEGESTLGRVTCYTCHQGEAKPKAAAPAAP
jgi:Photosynthetic reaction centre cytochrome C subunit